MFLKEKYTATGEFDKLKARLVARGDQQDKTLYEVLSSPTVALPAIMLTAWIISTNTMVVSTVDIVGAFLNAEETYEVHMRLSKELANILVDIDASRYKDFLCPDGSIIVKLEKALYGLVEAPRLWYDLLRSAIQESNFRASEYDECVFVKHDIDNQIIGIMALHVDDLLIGCCNNDELNKISQALKAKFKDIKVNDGPIVNYLGMTLDFEHAGKVTVTQKGYVSDLITLYNVDKKSFNPASGKLFVVGTDEEILDTKGQDYLRSGVAKLLYLAKRTVPELAPVVAFLSTRAEKFTISDLSKFDKAIAYLATFEHKGLTLHCDSEDANIHVYIDASHGIHADGKSHTGCAISFGKAATIYTKSAKQKVVSKSSTEAELIALSDSLSMILWTRNFLEDLKIKFSDVVVHEDNTSTIALITKGLATSDSMKHVKVRTFLMKQHIDSGEIKVVHCNSDAMWADLLTKPLQGAIFWKHLSSITGQFRGKKGAC
jgi:hypothetical protein